LYVPPDRPAPPCGIANVAARAQERAEMRRFVAKRAVGNTRTAT